jgi:hypothetical protein
MNSAMHSGVVPVPSAASYRPMFTPVERIVLPAHPANAFKTAQCLRPGLIRSPSLRLVCSLRLLEYYSYQNAWFYLPARAAFRTA